MNEPRLKKLQLKKQLDSKPSERPRRRNTRQRDSVPNRRPRKRRHDAEPLKRKRRREGGQRRRRRGELRKRRKRRDVRKSKTDRLVDQRSMLHFLGIPRLQRKCKFLESKGHNYV